MCHCVLPFDLAAWALKIWPRTVKLLKFLTILKLYSGILGYWYFFIAYFCTNLKRVSNAHLTFLFLEPFIAFLAKSTSRSTSRICLGSLREEYVSLDWCEPIILNISTVIVHSPLTYLPNLPKTGNNFRMFSSPCME